MTSSQSSSNYIFIYLYIDEFSLLTSIALSNTITCRSRNRPTASRRGRIHLLLHPTPTCLLHTLSLHQSYCGRTSHTHSSSLLRGSSSAGSGAGGRRRTANLPRAHAVWSRSRRPTTILGERRAVFEISAIDV